MANIFFHWSWLLHFHDSYYKWNLTVNKIVLPIFSAVKVNFVVFEIIAIHDKIRVNRL